MDAYSIVRHLREHYNEQVRIERFKVTELLFSSKMEEGTSLVQHALKMYEHIERLNQLGYGIDFELSVYSILASLPDSFVQFVIDYRMNYIVSTMSELVNVLKIAKENWLRRKEKRLPRKRLASIVVKMAIGRGTIRPTWSRRRRWHVRHHHLEVFMTLRLILFLLTTYGYMQGLKYRST